MNYRSRYSLGMTEDHWEVADRLWRERYGDGGQRGGATQDIATRP